MKRLAAAAALAAAAFVASCDDQPNAKPKEPLAPPAPVAQSLSAMLSARVHATTVCMSYLREGTRVQARLVQAPKDTALVKRANALAMIIADACQ